MNEAINLFKKYLEEKLNSAKNDLNFQQKYLESINVKNTYNFNNLSFMSISNINQQLFNIAQNLISELKYQDQQINDMAISIPSIFSSISVILGILSFFDFGATAIPAAILGTLAGLIGGVLGGCVEALNNILNWANNIVQNFYNDNNENNNTWGTANNPQGVIQYLYNELNIVNNTINQLQSDVSQLTPWSGIIHVPTAINDLNNAIYALQQGAQTIQNSINNLEDN